MKLSEQVEVLEENFVSMWKAYKNDLQSELSNADAHITLSDLVFYPGMSSHIKNQFYPMGSSYTNRNIGLILPVRRLIFHSLKTETELGDRKRLEALTNLASRRGYQIEYQENAWQYDSIILGIMEDRLPTGDVPF
jgi:hypothetical protein